MLENYRFHCLIGFEIGKGQKSGISSPCAHRLRRRQLNSDVPLTEQDYDTSWLDISLLFKQGFTQAINVSCRGRLDVGASACEGYRRNVQCS